MKKTYSKQELLKLEKEMRDPSVWEEADHTVSFKGPTSIRFSEDILAKLHAIAKVRKKPISRLVNEYVRPFVEGEFEVLEQMR